MAKIMAVKFVFFHVSLVILMAKATFKLQKFHVRINVTALPWVSGQRLGSTSSLRLHLRYDASTNTIDSTRGRGCWPLETWPFCRYLPPQPRLWGPGRGRVTTPATTRCTNVAVLGASCFAFLLVHFILHTAHLRDEHLHLLHVHMSHLYKRTFILPII